tara:strand:+ start:1419 stop:2426 length:1008 start_codon:yes stop_codon:yes gene_type:complete
MKRLFFVFIIFAAGCEDSKTKNQSEELTFISNEGNFGSSNGSVSVFRSGKLIQEIKDIGDVVQSILVHKEKLFVLVNNSHLLKIYQISDDGLELPGISVSTEGSGPREMVVENNKLYFTNYYTQDVKVLNLSTYYIEDSISLDGLPESIVSDGANLWVAINMNSDYSSASSVVKINIESGKVTKAYEVGKGPQQLLIDENQLWISRTYYSPDFTETYYGTSKIDMKSEAVSILDYGKGTVCGGDVFQFNNQAFRTYNGGAAPLNADLSLQPLSKIGSYNSNHLYSANGFDEKLFLGITSDYTAPDTVYVHNSLGEVEEELIVGASPGDYAIYKIK